MVIVGYKKTVQVVGVGEPVKTDDTYNYYLTGNFTSERQKRGLKILFQGSKKECLQFIENMKTE